MNLSKNKDLKTINEMNFVLRERSKGKSRKECAKLAKIRVQRIQNWYTEGKNGFGEENIRFYKHLKAIEERLFNDEKYAKEIKEFERGINVTKRTNFLNNIRKGQTRKEASGNASLNLKLATKWDSLGRKGIKPFKKFHNEYKNARQQAERKKDLINTRIKERTIKHIKTGKSIQEAAKIVENGNYETTILNWYSSGKSGNSKHNDFYVACNESRQKPVNSDILGPLPRKWKKYFENKPMNQTGIAWVNKMGNNYVYQRQILNETIRISDSDIYQLHKKVISRNYVWGIRDMNKAQKIIKKNSSNKNNVTAIFTRSSKNTFNVKIKGIIENNEVRETFNKLKFFEVDKKQSHEIKIGNKTKINLEYNLNISLLNSFKSKIRKLGWRIKED